MRWIGVSNFDVQQLRRAQAIAPVTSLQPRYSLVHREIENEILPYCMSEGIGGIVYSPMASGLLTGAMTRERAAKLPKNDWRRGHPDFTEPNLSHNLALVDRMRAIANHHSRSVGEIAIAWTLRDPAVTGAIVGARKCAAGRGSHARWRVAPHRRRSQRDRKLRRDRGVKESCYHLIVVMNGLVDYARLR